MFESDCSVTTEQCVTVPLRLAEETITLDSLSQLSDPFETFQITLRVRIWRRPIATRIQSAYGILATPHD